MLDRRMSADRMPARRGLLPLADVPDRERRDGGPELVIECKDAVIPMPVLARRRHEIREPVEKLKGRELDDAIGPRPRGLPPSPRANPVGRLVSGEHIADAGDAAVPTTPDGEPLQCKVRTGTVSQQVFKRLTIDTQLETKERDPHAGVHRKTTVFWSEHVGGRIGVEEPLHAEPPHDTTAHLLGECGQIRLGDRPSRQERRPPVTGRHEDAVGRARMQVHVVIERRSEAVQKGHGTESRASRARLVAVTGRARRSTE
jgi:hypothetical protein